MNLERQRNKVVRSALYLAVPVAIAAYFVVHKPWAQAVRPSLLMAALDVVLAGLLTLIAAGLGRRTLGELDGLDPFEEIALQAGIGIGVLSLLVLAFGAIGPLNPVAAWLGLVIGLLVFGRSGAGWAAQWRQLATDEISLDGLGLPAAVLSVALAGVALLQALAPPLKWDSLVYHLELPKQYLRQGDVGFVSGNLFVGFPQLAELGYTWAMALRAGPTAAVLGWAVGVIALAGLAGMARRLLGSRAFWIAPAVVLSGASLWQGLAWAYVDHWLLLYGLMMFACLDRWFESAPHHRRWLVLAGVSAGFALGTKYTGGLLLAIGLVMVWFGAAGSANGELRHHGLRTFWTRLTGAGRWRSRLGYMVILAGVALLVFAPWLLRNLLIAGNPLHPFLLPGREVDAMRQLYQAQDLPARTLLDDLMLPVQAIVFGIEGGPRFNTSLGPLYLGLIPGLLMGLDGLGAARRRSLRRFVWVGLGLWMMWALGARVAAPLTRSRHYYGFLPVLAILASAGYLRLRQGNLFGVDVGWVLEKLILFSFSLTALAALFHLGRVNPLPVLTGQHSRTEYLSDQLGWFGPVMEAVNDLPSHSHTRFLWEPRGYYCQLECAPDVILDHWWYLRRTVGDPDRIAARWREHGVSHVLIYDLGVRLEMQAQPLLTEADWKALAEFRNEQLELLQQFDGAYSLYRLK